jgi:hypothetical protein
MADDLGWKVDATHAGPDGEPAMSGASSRRLRGFDIALAVCTVSHWSFSHTVDDGLEMGDLP